MTSIGFHENKQFDQKRERAVWNNDGKVVFRGSAYLGKGNKLSNSGTIVLGGDFQVSGNSQIV